MPFLFALMGFVVATGHLVGMDSELRETGVGNVWRASRRAWLAGAAVVVAALVGGAVYWQPILSVGYSNLGAIYHTKAELAPDLRPAGRAAAAARANAFYIKALKLNPTLPAANRRLGLLAFERQDFETAVTYLEQAYGHEPENQATLKALGLAYAWTGRLDSAEELLGQLDRRDEVVGELGTWSWWWGTHDREDLAKYAEEMVESLS
jgi:tetratricopeptide (TPR) repeat protein